MMDTNVEKLQAKIEQLTNENLRLKELVEDLKKELDLKGIAYDPNEPVTLVNYYLKKYLAIHEQIYKRRLKKLEDQRMKLQDEYDLITKQEEGMDLIANKNQELLTRIKEIEENISSNYYELEKKKFEFDNKVKKVTQEDEELEKSTTDLYKRILTLMNTSLPSVVVQEVSHVMEILKNVIYPTVISINENKLLLINELDDINSVNQEIKIKTKNLTQEKENLEHSIQTVSLETIDNMLDSLALELTKVASSKDELEQLFSMLKEQNIKRVQDEIKHLQVLEYSNKDIAVKMDEIIQKIENELINADTVSNMQLNLTMELSKLSSRLAEVNEKKLEYEQKYEDYQQVSGVLATVNGNISKLEDYLNLTTKAISSSKEYSSIVAKYEGLLATIVLLNQEIEKAKVKLDELKEERRLKAFDPYAKATIQKITSEIKNLELLLEKYHQDLDNTNLEISRLAQEKQNLKIINVIKDKKNIEMKLPSLYDQQKELNTIVALKHDELEKLEKYVKEYDDLLLQIEDIKRELNNM